MSEMVVLVNELDMAVGLMEKMAAHESGVLHRALSVFIFNTRGEMLLQQRALGKYHSAGLWSNACCSHPRQGEDIMAAAHRRLKEELGIDCDLREVFSFVYKAHLDHGLTEHEYDHVFIGITDEVPVPDPDEVNAWEYLDEQALISDVAANPGKYSEWFRICLKDYRGKLFVASTD